MYINITDSEMGNNKGSCGALVHYLEKENRLGLEDSRHQELWFSGTRKDIAPQEVRIHMDNNIAKLGKVDAKFYLVNISPSRKELIFLKERFGQQGAEEGLKEFAVKVMDNYARNFRRPGIENGNDLLWYGKLEHHRYYSYHDKEVKEGVKRCEERKEGEQMHIQVLVSRKDITNKIKLSPMNNSRGKNQQHSARLGQFDRRAFKQSGEALFDEVFHYNRGLKDTMDYALMMRNGTTHQKRSLHVLEQAESRLSDVDKETRLQMAQDVFRDTGYGLEQLLGTGTEVAGSFLSILLAPDQANQEPEKIIPVSRKKKKKGRSRG